ncbi:MAG: BatA domain-containing protein [Verrucomicrobia bacterium]|nr:BatA domain-containing protein [Verrucomicrobiota bacterium]
MSFLNPLLLFGGLAIASPIIIHLLAKKQIKRVVWAAMRFLKVTVDRNKRKMNIEDILLLILRCLILALLAFALARPSLREGGFGGFGGDEAAILLVDNSGSMSATDGAVSRFEKTQKAAEQILGGLPAGSRVAVWLVSDTVRESVSEPARDLALARKSIREAKRTDQGTEWQPALRRAVEVLKKQPGVHKHIYAVTDGQAAGWKGVGEIRTLLESVKREMRATLVLTTEGEERNLGITDVRLATALPTVNQPLRFEVSVANFGPAEVGGVAVSLAIDDEPPAEEQMLDTIAVGGAPKSLSLFATFREPGFHTVTARLHSDRCPFDDQRSFALRVIDEVNVLLVDGDPGAEPRDSEVFYLRNALTPVPAELRDRFFIKTRTVTGAEFEKTTLRDFDAVVLANVVDLSPIAADALQAYVRGGGGLLVFPGSRISVPFYNGLLLGERSLLPAAFGPVRGENFDETRAERPDKVFRLQAKDYAHRIVELWKDPASGSLASAQFYRAFTLQPTKQSDVPGDAGLPAVVLSFADGEPAVIERPFGLGRVVQFSSTADGAWNDLPVRPIFLPLMHRTLGFLLARTGDRLNVRAGTPFTHTVTAERAGKSYTVTEPGAKSGIARTSTVMVKNGTPQIEQADTAMAGAYAIHFTEETGNAVRFAAASDPGESDLHELSAADLTALGTVARIVRWTPEADLRGQMERERNGTELWLPFALLAIGLVVAETLLGNRFSRSK